MTARPVRRPLAAAALAAPARAQEAVAQRLREAFMSCCPPSRAPPPRARSKEVAVECVRLVAVTNRHAAVPRPSV